MFSGGIRAGRTAGHGAGLRLNGERAWRIGVLLVAGVVLFAYAANPPKTAAASGHTTPVRQAASVASGWAHFSPGLEAARWGPRDAGKIRSQGG